MRLKIIFFSQGKFSGHIMQQNYIQFQSALEDDTNVRPNIISYLSTLEPDFPNVEHLNFFSQILLNKKQDNLDCKKLYRVCNNID